MTGTTTALNWLLGIFGGFIGGALGYFLFFQLTRQGFYAMVMPGALLGLGCGFLSGMKSQPLGIVSGLLALLLGFIIEWQFAPFVRDKSFAFFITHVHELKSVTLVLIGLGGLFGYWFGKGRVGGVGLRRSKSVSVE